MEKKTKLIKRKQIKSNQWFAFHSTYFRSLVFPFVSGFQVTFYTRYDLVSHTTETETEIRVNLMEVQRLTEVFYTCFKRWVVFGPVHTELGGQLVEVMQLLSLGSIRFIRVSFSVSVSGLFYTRLKLKEFLYMCVHNFTLTRVVPQ